MGTSYMCCWWFGDPVDQLPPPMGEVLPDTGMLDVPLIRPPPGGPADQAPLDCSPPPDGCPPPVLEPADGDVVRGMERLFCTCTVTAE